MHCHVNALAGCGRYIEDTQSSKKHTDKLPGENEKKWKGEEIMSTCPHLYLSMPISMYLCVRVHTNARVHAPGDKLREYANIPYASSVRYHTQAPDKTPTLSGEFPRRSCSTTGREGATAERCVHGKDLDDEIFPAPPFLFVCTEI